jgi:hypothetical protein
MLLCRYNQKTVGRPKGESRDGSHLCLEDCRQKSNAVKTASQSLAGNKTVYLMNANQTHCLCAYLLNQTRVYG